MTWVKLVSLSQVSHRERLEEPTTTTNTGCSACVQGMPCSPFFHSPTAEQHRRMEMLIQLGRLWPRMVVELLHPLIPSSPLIPEPGPRGGRGSAHIHPAGEQSQPRLSRVFSFKAGSPAGEEPPGRDHWVSEIRQLAPEAGRAGPRPQNTRREETGTYPRRAAGGCGEAAPGGGEVGRRGSRAPVNEGEQGPQQEGGRGAAQVQAEPEQDGARPRASCPLQVAGPQVGEGHSGEYGHGHWHPPAPAARRAPCGRRILSELRPPLTRGSRGRRGADVGGIGVHAASCAAKDRHISCPAVPRRCPGRWPLRGASSRRRSRHRRRSGGRGSPRSCPRRRHTEGSNRRR